jgi:DNA-binding transcriptional LysR family regulator
MEQRQVLNFLSICEDGNITRAAERRGITRQGLSKSIRDLEEELEVPLFERGRKGVELTEYGRIMEKAAKSWTGQHDYIRETIRAIKEKSGSTVTIGITDSYVRRFPRRFFSGFLAAHPGVELSVKTFPHTTCQDYVREQKLQAGFTMLPGDGEMFDTWLLQKDRMRIYVGKSHPLAGRKKARLEEFRGESYIALSQGGRENGAVKELCDKHGIRPGVILSHLDTGLMTEFCESGRYINFLAGRPPRNKNIRPIEIEDAAIYSELYLIVNRRAFINSAAEAFIAWSKEQFVRNRCSVQNRIWHTG